MRVVILVALLVLTAVPALACGLHTTSSDESQTASTATDKSGG